MPDLLAVPTKRIGPKVLHLARTTFSDCGGPHDLTLAHSISNWESKATTCAEQAVIRYLCDRPPLHREKKLLHVGIGNGALFAAVGEGLAAFTGITISRPELDHFQRRFQRRPTVVTLLANKHDERSFASIGGRFDVIVDVNLKSFACCEKHFRRMMQYFAEALSPGGILITAQSGLDFGWAGNTAVAFTPGADTDPSSAEHRILRADGLVELAAQFGLQAHRMSVPPSATCEAETLWILGKD